MDNEIMVSICCLVYNHEKYLRQCLDGFIMQKTNFKFEVLVHDDASTDGSADIIREYEKKYPEIIKPIYQKENQFSKGVKISWTFQYPRAKGKYIALCEGDDFWTDLNKLQKQFDLLEKDESIAICAHAVHYISENGDMTDKFKPNPLGVDRIYSSKEFIHEMMLTNIIPYQTSSFFFRSIFLRKLDYCIPKFFRVCKVGDVTLLLFFGHQGNVGYIADEMSCYRMMSKNSWSARVSTNKDKLVEHKRNLIDTLFEYNEYTDHFYENEILDKINHLEFEILCMNYEYSELKKSPYKIFFKELPIKERLFIIINAKFPRVFRLYKKL